MALNLDDNKKPYFKQLGLDETFDEIQNAVNSLETQLPNSGSSITVESVTLSTQPTTVSTTANTINVLTVDSNGQIGKKQKSNAKVWRGIFTQAGTSAPVVTVLENELGGTIVWTRDGVGNYRGTLTAKFNTEKTFMNGQSTYLGNKTKVDVFHDLGGNLNYVYMDCYDDNGFSVTCRTLAGGYVEWSSAIGSTPYFIDVLVYQD